MCANTPSSLQLLQQQMDQDHPVSCVWSSPEVPQAGRQARYAPQACTLCVQSKMTCSGRSRGAQAFEELSQAFAGQPAGQASSEPDVQLDIQVKQASEVKTCRAKSSHCHWWAVICCNSCAGGVSPANCHEVMLMHSIRAWKGCTGCPMSGLPAVPSALILHGLAVTSGCVLCNASVPLSMQCSQPGPQC